MNRNPICLVALVLSQLVSPFVCDYSADTTATGNLLRSGLQLSERLSSAAARGMTSSQVIEYNPRNIALMTLLNSVLILGGLLGTMARNDKVHPFKKRVDFSSFKKKLLPRRRKNGQPVSTPVPPVAPAPPTMASPVSTTFQTEHPYPVFAEHPHPLHRPVRLFEVADNGLAPSYHPHHHLTKQPEFLSLPETAYDINPRVPLQIVHRRHDLARDSSSSLSSSSTAAIEVEASSCGHELRCLDRAGKLQRNPSPSELSKSALKLLNSATSSQQLTQYSSLLAKVRELIEIEERGQCFLHFTCQNVPLTGRSPKKTPVAAKAPPTTSA